MAFPDLYFRQGTQYSKMSFLGIHHKMIICIHSFVQLELKNIE